MEKGNNLSMRKLNRTLQANAIPMLDTDIILGNPKHNCRYHGICEILPTNTFRHFSEYPELCISKTQMYFNDNNYLEILFKKRTISNRTKQLHFSDSFFTVSESIDVPLFVSDFLNSNYTIKAGKYFINSEEGHYKIIFKREPDFL